MAMDSAQQSSFCSSLSSPRLQIKEPTVSDDKNESQLCLKKKPKPETATEDVESRIQIIEDSVNAYRGTESEAERARPILQYPNLSVPPADSVFSIDHLLELILFECDMRTLLGCRHVCRRWAYYGCKALQRRVNTITFVHKFDFRRRKPIGFQYEPYRRFCIDDLTACMSNSTDFPCNSFCFSNDRGGYGSFTPQPFLNAHGTRIKKLRFYGTLKLDHVRQILLTQVPNLEQLILTHINIFDRPSKITGTETAEERATRLKALFNDVTNVNPKQIFKHLKVFEGNSSIPKVFTQQILEQSPKIIKISIPTEYFELLLKPVNRVYLLKKLVIKIKAENIGAFESFANYNGGNLALQEIQYLGFSLSDKNNVNNHDNDILHSRVVGVMRKILEISRPSCQTLKIKKFLKNLQIPEMPQVKHLTVDLYELDELPLRVPVNGFPKGVNLGKTFPNLTTLRIGSLYDETLTLKHFIGDKSSQSPVLSVRNVNFGFEPNPDGPLSSNFSRLFPIATLKIVGRAESEVENDDSDSDFTLTDVSDGDDFAHEWDML